MTNPTPLPALPEPTATKEMPDIGKELFIACSLARGRSEERAQIDWDNWEGDFMTKDEWQRTAEQLLARTYAESAIAALGSPAMNASLVIKLEAAAERPQRYTDDSIYALLEEAADALRAAAPFAEIFEELGRATDKFPTWPTDPLHALAVLGEEFGELTKDVLQSAYEPHKTNRENVRKEALQTAAMAMRFFASLERYDYKQGPQHSQEAQ